MRPAPEVSVVIPTRGRAPLVSRAVRSVLAQTGCTFEVVVVVDGPDDATERALSNVDDRVSVVRLPASMGGGAARNRGVAAARGEWIAFLDDDDEWLPGKIAAQLNAARRCTASAPIICCRVIARSPRRDRIWPRRLPAAGEVIGDYLFARRGLTQGEGLVQTSTIFAPRSLLREIPFDESLRIHQDWDWMLHACAHGAQLVVLPDVLAVWNIEGHVGVTRRGDWKDSVHWIDSVRNLISPRAYAAFLLTSASANAARQHAWSASWGLLWRAARAAHLRPLDLLIFAAIWLVPQTARWRMRDALLHLRPSYRSLHRWRLPVRST